MFDSGSMIYWLRNLKMYSETECCIELRFQLKVNHGPEWSVD